MKHLLSVLLLPGLFFYACAQHRDRADGGFNADDFRLIQACVAAILQLDPGLNGTKYAIDFRGVRQLDRRAIAHFLQLNPVFTETDADSLARHDSTWIKYQFFQNPVISLEQITTQKDGTLLINTSKTKASDGAIGTEILLRREGDHFRCLDRKITWIS